jgi:hypothetical protein
MRAAWRVARWGMQSGVRQGMQSGVRQGMQSGVRQGVRQGVRFGVRQGVASASFNGKNRSTGAFLTRFRLATNPPLGRLAHD